MTFYFVTAATGLHGPFNAGDLAAMNQRLAEKAERERLAAEAIAAQKAADQEARDRAELARLQAKYGGTP